MKRTLQVVVALVAFGLVGGVCFQLFGARFLQWLGPASGPTPVASASPSPSPSPRSQPSPSPVQSASPTRTNFDPALDMFPGSYVSEDGGDEIELAVRQGRLVELEGGAEVSEFMPSGPGIYQEAPQEDQFRQLKLDDDGTLEITLFNIGAGAQVAEPPVRYLPLDDGDTPDTGDGPYEPGSDRYPPPTRPDEF